MENTSALLFDGKIRRYFLALEGKAQGPLTEKEVFERISRKECSVGNFLWQEGWSDWKRILDVPEFLALVPQAPGKSSLEKIQARLAVEKAKKNQSPKTPTAKTPDTPVHAWFIYAHDTQFGPFSQAELQQSLQSQNIAETDFVWRQGFSNWKPLKEVDELADALESMRPTKKNTQAPPPVPSGKKAERRRSPRKPLVAKLFIHNEKDLVIAMCRDISMGGMQVLTDRIPGELGEKIKLNVSPNGPGAAKSTDADEFKGFVAEGEIVRILEDGRGFSFRFTKLSPEAKKAIDDYLKTSP